METVHKAIKEYEDTDDSLCLFNAIAVLLYILAQRHR